MSLVVDGRFNGPPRVVNGGYACGLVAQALDGVVEVSLKRPVPVETPLDLSVEDGDAVLVDDHGVELARGVAVAGLEVELPGAVGIDDAAAAMSDYPAHDWGDRMFPCFVCGPVREDSLGVFPGPVPDRGVVATTWTPREGAADVQQLELITSAVLDCTGSWGAIVHNELVTGALLARMATRVERSPAVGETYVAVGWGGPRDGRKLPAGAALYDGDGAVVAYARLLCIEPRTH